MTDDTNGTATAGPPPTADLQDPLPESSWLWRRVFIFAVSAAILVMIWNFGDRLADAVAVAITNQTPGDAVVAIKALLIFVRWLLAGMFILMLFYLVAPSAEQITKMIQTARSLREGVIFSGSARAATPAGTAETSTSSGIPPTTPHGAGASGRTPPIEAPPYEGPDLSDAPVPPSNVPEEPTWR